MKKHRLLSIIMSLAMAFTLFAAFPQMTASAEARTYVITNNASDSAKFDVSGSISLNAQSLNDIMTDIASDGTTDDTKTIQFGNGSSDINDPLRILDIGSGHA